MTITHVGTGAASHGTTTVTPAYFSTPAAGQLAILTIDTASPTDEVPSVAQSGWQFVGTGLSTVGAYGLDAGPRRRSYFVKQLEGSDVQPAPIIPSGTGATITAYITQLSKSTTQPWSWVSIFSEDFSSGTGFSAPFFENMSFTPGDFLLLGYTSPSDAPAYSAEVITATGVTFGAVTEQRDEANTNGHNLRSVLATCAVTAGVINFPPTITATLSVAGTGLASILRIRETYATVATSVLGTFPPRVNITVSELQDEHADTLTIYRVVGSERTALRGAVDVPSGGDDTFVVTDAEEPFNITFTYTVVITDVNGDVTEISSTSVTITSVDPDSVILSDATTGFAAPVMIVSWRVKQYQRDATVHNVGDRAVVVMHGRRKAPLSTLVVQTITATDAQLLADLLDNASLGIIQVRQANTFDDVDVYVAVLNSAKERTFGLLGYTERTHPLDVVEVEPWPVEIEARGFTYADWGLAFPRYIDAMNAYATYLAALQADLS